MSDQTKKQVTSVLDAMINGTAAAAALRETMSRQEYETAYIIANNLRADNYIVNNGEIVKHAPAWTRRIR